MHFERYHLCVLARAAAPFDWARGVGVVGFLRA